MGHAIIPIHIVLCSCMSDGYTYSIRFVTTHLYAHTAFISLILHFFYFLEYVSILICVTGNVPSVKWKRNLVGEHTDDLVCHSPLDHRYTYFPSNEVYIYYPALPFQAFKPLQLFPCTKPCECGQVRPSASGDAVEDLHVPVWCLPITLSFPGLGTVPGQVMSVQQKMENQPLISFSSFDLIFKSFRNNNIIIIVVTVV